MASPSTLIIFLALLSPIFSSDLSTSWCVVGDVDTDEMPSLRRPISSDTVTKLKSNQSSTWKFGSRKVKLVVIWCSSCLIDLEVVCLLIVASRFGWFNVLSLFFPSYTRTWNDWRKWKRDSQLRKGRLPFLPSSLHSFLPLSIPSFFFIRGGYEEDFHLSGKQEQQYTRQYASLFLHLLLLLNLFSSLVRLSFEIS